MKIINTILHSANTRSAVTEFELYQNVHEEEPEVPPTDPTEPADEPDDDLITDITEILEALELVEGLDTSLYTEESYAALLDAVAAVYTVIQNEAGYTQEMADEVYELLTEALDGLELAETEDPTDPEKPGADEDLPADTGDIVLTVLCGMMSLAAAGGAAIVGKKKE